MDPDLNTLRQRADRAYSRWRGARCDGLRPRDVQDDQHCAELKAELDSAEDAVRLARGERRSVRD
jgi:hypothetical protein